MQEIGKDKESKQKSDRKDHLANERTFLAWIRTSLGIMAFGFVLEKFALFIKQISFFLERSGDHRMSHFFSMEQVGYSSVLGVLLVALGTLIAPLSFIKYKRVERQIEEERYQTSSLLEIILSLSVFGVGIFLIIYLIYSI